MTGRSTRRVAASAVSLLALALAGCGSGGGDAGGDGDGSGSSAPEPGPLAEYYERAYGEYDEDQANRDMRRVEEVVADCMAEQGFDYTPVDPAAQGGSFVSQDDLDVEWGTLEFAQQYGYGITTNPFGDPEEQGPEEEFVDPNAEYVEAMSESEREAYFVALYGEQPEPVEGEEPEEMEYDWQTAGCQGRGQHEVYEAGMDDPGVASLEEEMSEVWTRVQEDPRLADVTAAWVDCMAGAGFSGLASPDDPSMRISEKASAVYEEVYPQDASMAEMPTAEEMEALEGQVQERLGEITEEEIETAVADVTCREEVGLDDTMQEVTVDLEQEFVDTHKEELEAWVEATTAARS